MKRQDFRFFHRLRVRWAEVDMQKIVFNAHYLMYFDTAIADYWRAIGLPYEAAMEHLEGDLYVKKAVVEFHASARADDQIDVAMRCARIGNSSIQFVCAIFRGDQLLITGELIYVFADPRTQTSRPVPPVLRGILDDFEAGRPVVELLQGEWAALGADAARVRTEVFIEEQAIPKEMEWEEADATALHAIVRNRLGQPLATGRLLTEAPGVGRIGRMAVIRVMRGTQLGADVLKALLAAAWARGDREVVLSAQRSAAGFYSRLGFEERGPDFEEAGIAHVEMVRRR